MSSWSPPGSRAAPDSRARSARRSRRCRRTAGNSPPPGHIARSRSPWAADPIPAGRSKPLEVQQYDLADVGQQVPGVGVSVDRPGRQGVRQFLKLLVQFAAAGPQEVTVIGGHPDPARRGESARFGADRSRTAHTDNRPARGTPRACGPDPHRSVPDRRPSPHARTRPGARPRAAADRSPHRRGPTLAAATPVGFLTKPEQDSNVVLGAR